jgi:hypothetical protein
VKSLSGLITINRTCFTKYNAELKPIVQELKVVRQNLGVEKLKIFTTDNLNGDGGLWQKSFPELKEGVVPYAPPDNDGYACTTIDECDYKYITNVDDTNNFALSLYNEGSLGGGTTDKVHYGLDAEWNAFDGTSHITRCIQIAIPGASTAVCHLHPAMNISNSSSFPADLKRLLEDKRIVPVGRGVGGDISRLRKLGVKIKQWQELPGLALAVNPSIHSTSLNSLSKVFIGSALQKFGQREDYSCHRLEKQVVEYAALAARVSIMIAQKIHQHQGGVSSSRHARYGSTGLSVDQKIGLWEEAQLQLQK